MKISSQGDLDQEFRSRDLYAQTAFGGEDKRMWFYFKFCLPVTEHFYNCIHSPIYEQSFTILSG